MTKLLSFLAKVLIIWSKKLVAILDNLNAIV